MKELIEKDANYINFDIAKPENSKDSFSVSIARSVYGADDMIKVSDTKSIIGGKPYEYIFARKNRAPALHYLKNNVLEFNLGFQLIEDDILQGDTIKAEDPDEDTPLFWIKTSGQIVIFPFEVTTPETNFVIEANDGKLTDYQTITINGVENG